MSSTVAEPVRSQPGAEPFTAVKRARYHSTLIGGAIATGDLFSLTVALGCAYLACLWGKPQVLFHPVLLAAPVCTVVAFFVQGYYPGLGLTAVQHMRRICRVITIVYLLLSTFIFLSKDPPVYSRELILLAWFFSLFALPLARWVTRMP